MLAIQADERGEAVRVAAPGVDGAGVPQVVRELVQDGAGAERWADRETQPP